MKPTGRTETFIGVFILLVLAAIAAAVFGTQSRYDPALFKALEIKGDAGKTSSAPASDCASLFTALAPETLTLLGGTEIFDSGTLSDKINGKAELYLASGFVGLATQRFSRKADPTIWLEVFVYDMGEAANAFSVYSLQKRSDARPADFGPFAYSTENALFFVNGSKYIEIVSAETGLAEEVRTLAKNLVDSQPREQSCDPAEFTFFPPESLDKSTISLHMSDVFGFSGLDRVYTARYRVGEEEVTAFISKRETPEESEALAGAYRRFLLENSAKDLGEVSGVPGSKLFQVFDTFEAVLHRGLFLAGSHEVETREAAERIAADLYRQLGTTPAGSDMKE